MPEIKVWECPKTAKLFRSKSAYVRHLKKTARENITRINQEKEKVALSAQISSLYECKTYNEIEEWLFVNQDLICRFFSHPNYDSEKFGKVVRISLTEMRWEDRIPMTHSSPICMKDNFHQKPEYGPTHSPGWRGRIEFIYENNDRDFPFHDRWRSVNICTGSGGASGNKSSYEVTLWAADFPQLKEWGNGEFYSTIETSNPVFLEKCFYYEHPAECFRRAGSKWQKVTSLNTVLHPIVDKWLRTYVGYDFNEIWDCDRTFYPDEILPPLGWGNYSRWERMGLNRLENIKGTPKGRFSLDSKKDCIYFEYAADAEAFVKHFRNWFINSQLIKRLASSASNNTNLIIREYDGLIYGIARVVIPNTEILHGIHNLELPFISQWGEKYTYLLRDEHDRTMLSIVCPGCEIVLNDHFS